MKATACLLAAALGLALGPAVSTPNAQGAPPAGFVSIFNGKDLTGWKVPVGDNGHWKVVDGVIDYDAGSEAPADKNLWTVKAYKNFEAKVDWRIKATPYVSNNMRIVMPDGHDKLNEKGEPIRITAPDSDSGFILRGSGKAQLNIWCWPVGSGEMYGYRTAKDTSPELRAAVTPKMNADNDIGKWNTFEVTAQGNRVTLRLNGKLIIDNVTLPDLPAEGPLGLQHHGGVKDGVYTGIPALVQFRNIYVKEMP
jgi:3-keto-disaccharide hydrolase